MGNEASSTPQEEGARGSGREGPPVRAQSGFRSQGAGHGSYGMQYGGAGWHSPKPREGDPKKGLNYRFYSGAARHPGTNLKIGEFIEQIWGDYEYLERAHDFVQFIFPIFESSGMAMTSEALGKKEAQQIRSEWKTNVQFIRIYRLMLNFYGFRLVSLETGKVQRHPNRKFWKERFQNNVDHPHNNLRISRILICLGEMGFEHWKRPLLRALRREVVKRKTLAPCRDSYERFWSRLLDYDTKWYQQKTLEAEEDREPCAFVKILRDEVKRPSSFDRILEELGEVEADCEKRIEEYAASLRERRRRLRREIRLFRAQRIHGGEKRRNRGALMILEMPDIDEYSSSWDDSQEGSAGSAPSSEAEAEEPSSSDEEDEEPVKAKPSSLEKETPKANQKASSAEKSDGKDSSSSSGGEDEGEKSTTKDADANLSETPTRAGKNGKKDSKSNKKDKKASKMELVDLPMGDDVSSHEQTPSHLKKESAYEKMKEAKDDGTRVDSPNLSSYGGRSELDPDGDGDGDLP